MLMATSVHNRRSENAAIGCPSVATAMARLVITTSVTPTHIHRSRPVSRPCRCRFRMVRFISDEAGTKNARFASTACVTPIVRSSVMYCTTNCAPISASEPTISQRDWLITLSRLTLLGISTMSAEHIITIMTMAANCISFIRFLFGVQIYTFSYNYPNN